MSHNALTVRDQSQENADLVRRWLEPRGGAARLSVDEGRIALSTENSFCKMNFTVIGGGV